ncbi:MAG: hypothetical protein ACTHOD_01735 [Motilibacteraceae bacterium]
MSGEEQERRLVDPARQEFHKLADVETLRRLRAQSQDARIDEPPADLHIDTGSSDPARAVPADPVIVKG